MSAAPVYHYVTAGLGGGFVCLPSSTQTPYGKPTSSAGAEGQVAGGYALQKGAFIAHTRLQVAFRHIRTEMSPYTLSSPIQDAEMDEYQRLTTYSDCKGVYDRLDICLPLKVGFQLKRFYGLFGPMIGAQVYGKGRLDAMVTTKGDYEPFYDIFENMPNHGFSSYPLKGNDQPIPSHLWIAAGAELGMIVWEKKYKRLTYATWLPQVRLALYTDYCFWASENIPVSRPLSFGLKVAVWWRAPQKSFCRCADDNWIRRR